MATNKLALLRYKTIDQCLQNRYRKWTLQDLMSAVSDALYEHEGISDGVGKRTLQQDIQVMRSDKLGYHAPIIVVERKYYTYADSDYSITNSPLSETEVERLKDLLGSLRQFKGFSYFEDLSAMLTKLEDKLVRQKNQGRSFIHFDKNELYQGLDYIEPVYKAVAKKLTLLVKYQSFKADQPQERVFFPYLLKEYNNRWFVLGKAEGSRALLLFALDRIISLREASEVPFHNPPSPLIDRFFDDVIGVSKTSKQRARLIVMRIYKSDLPYILTKPIHPSQKILKEEENWVIFSIEVIWNFELEREILGRGERLEVLSPRRLREKVQRRAEALLEIYQQPHRA